MSTTTVQTKDAPAAIGPYSQGIISNGLLFTAGQIPLDPTTGEMVEGDLKAQAKRVLENLKAVLAAANSSFESVVKVNVYLTSMSDFPAMNEVYSEYFGNSKPARACVAVKELPKGSAIEIDLMAEVAN